MGVELAILLGKGWILLGIQPFVVCARDVCQRLRQPENGLAGMWVARWVGRAGA